MHADAVESAAVAAWSGLELLRPLAGGARNDVFLARCGDRQLVVRRSGRAAAALEWELDLLDHLGGHGVRVPGTVPADDGRRSVGGVLVQEFLGGRPPDGPADWRRAVDALRRVHELTVGWPQRPGFASARLLLTTDGGGDVRLDAMPEGAVADVRTAWRPVLTGPECAIHGDLGAGNIVIDDGAVGLLDWDESRVDVPAFDLAHVPEYVAVPSTVDRDVLVTAGVAWEAATCWVVEPVYALRRLAELRDRLRRPPGARRP